MKLLGALAVALALTTLVRLPAAWESGNALNHVSGTWMALADDLARGTLYRPIHAPGGSAPLSPSLSPRFAGGEGEGEAGLPTPSLSPRLAGGEGEGEGELWGGTRYFPLVFAAQAGLRRMGAPPLAAGHLASLAAALLLAAGVFHMVVRRGAERRAAIFPPIALAGLAGQHALGAARGDLLPVALSALALAAIARRPGRIPIAAALLLSLAFAAKPTALTALAAAVAFLLLSGARRRALTLAALVAAGASIVVAATDALSAGRFLAALPLLATAGAGPGAAVRAPIRLAEELAFADPAGLVLALAAAAVLAASLPGLVRKARRREDDPRLLPALWLVSAWCGALAVFATPGTGMNHLVELEAASAVLLGAGALSSGRAAAVARAGAPAAALAGIALAAALLRADLASSRLAEIRGVIRALPASAVLSEDPLVPLLAGERPALLDAFSVRVLGERDPSLVEPLYAALRRREFAAIVLFRDLGSPAADAWYAAGNLGLPAAREIALGYRRAQTIGRYRIYVPRAAPGEAEVVRRDEAR